MENDVIIELHWLNFHCHDLSSTYQIKTSRGQSETIEPTKPQIIQKFKDHLSFINF